MRALRARTSPLAAPSRITFVSAPRPAKAGRPPWGTSKVAKPHLLASMAVALLAVACATPSAPAAGPAAKAPDAPASSVVAAADAASSPAAAASAPANGASASTAARPDPAALKPFADIIKDAKQDEGLFPIWRKDEKAWLEIPGRAVEPAVPLCREHLVVGGRARLVCQPDGAELDGPSSAAWATRCSWWRGTPTSAPAVRAVRSAPWRRRSPTACWPPRPC